MSHWTKAAVITVGLAAGIGAGVAWTSPSNSVPEEPESGVPRAIAELVEAERSTAMPQTVDIVVAQAPRQSPQTEQDSDSESDAAADREGAANDDQAPTDQPPTDQPPAPQSDPQPQFSPVTPQPLEGQNTGQNTDPEAEIRAIRRELLQLLNRLEDLEAQLESDSNTTAQPSANASPSAQPSPPPSSFFDGPPPPQLSLGTQTISLPGDVLFDFNRSDIRPEAASMLEQVAGILDSMPYSHIQVAGHTDDVGDSDYNLVLSVERATAVQEFLQQALPDNGQGYRWTATGYGEAAPVADNETAEGRQRNRRVDLIVSPQ